MEDMVVQFVNNHPAIATVISGAVALSVFAKFVVNLTETPHDDAVFKKVYTVLEWLSGIVTSKAKQK